MVNKKEMVWWEEEREGGGGGRVNLSPQELFILRATESPYFPKPRNVRNFYIVANFIKLILANGKNNKNKK